MTIYDIAREAGVAASTVSRVMNNKPGVKAETRRKVERLLKKYNFVPDAAARGLVKQSTKIIGILIVDIRVTHHIDSAFVIEQEMLKRGYSCIIVSTGGSDEKKAEYIRRMEERRVEGLILMGSMFMTERVRESIRQSMPGVPVVIVNGYLDLPNVSGVMADEDEGIRRCVELMIAKGRRHLAFVQDADSPANFKKRDGYLLGMQQLAGESEPWVYRLEESSVNCGYEVTARILREHPELEGIIYSIDLVAMGGLRALRDAGKRVPEDIAVIGVDNTIYGEISYPKLSTLDNKIQDSSRIAAEILWNNIKEGPKRMQSKKMLLCSEIVEREST